MSDFEHINQAVEQNKAKQLDGALNETLKLLVSVAAVLLVLRGLESIGFISPGFWLILATVTVCAGFFKAGCIWGKVPR